MKPGTKVIATAKSIHSGQKGTVVADYVNVLLVEAEDQSYINAHKNSTHDKLCFQLDARAAKKVK